MLSFQKGWNQHEYLSVTLNLMWGLVILKQCDDGAASLKKSWPINPLLHELLHLHLKKNPEFGFVLLELVQKCFLKKLKNNVGGGVVAKLLPYGNIMQ